MSSARIAPLLRFEREYYAGSFGPALFRCPEEVACRVADHTRDGDAPIGAARKAV